MTILNIAGYRFVALTALPALRDHLLAECKAHHLMGTILLSPEGINLMLAGETSEMTAFFEALLMDSRFDGMIHHKTYTATRPFNRLKVKIRKEIITFRQSAINPLEQRAPTISPLEFRKWLDEGRSMVVLDTRNDFEVQFGAFQGAINPELNQFGEFPEAIANLPRDLPVVTYCTGGVRCEKAALAMMDAGFPEVYQLEGGILGYFAAVGDAHYQGDCFVFDERVAVNPKLQPIALK